MSEYYDDDGNRKVVCDKCGFETRVENEEELDLWTMTFSFVRGNNIRDFCPNCSEPENNMERFTEGDYDV